MNNKAFVIAVILATFLAFGMISIAFATTYYGPNTPNMEIHIYLNPDVENQDLETGTAGNAVDINDWPLGKEWVDKWALMPEKITLRDYVELGMMEIDIYHQVWPTGDSNNKFYDPLSTQSIKSVEFRKAVAMLLDRDSIVSNVLKGYGFRMDVPLPPFQDAYIDMTNYTDPLNYVRLDYNRSRANETLNAAGFTRIGGPTSLRQDPLMAPGVALKPLTFYIRQDDPNRRAAGEMLASELTAQGIPVNAIITERTVCYKNVMVLYNYNLYTGGWSLSSIPDQYHDLYSSFTYYGPSIGWSQNYPGFCNHEFDDWALKVKYPTNESEAQAAAKTAGYLFLKYCAIVPMYCSKAVKAYRTGWTGVVNNGGFGIDNYWTFLNGYSTTGDDQWDWAFKSDIEQLNQVSSEWLWDQNVLGLIYEGLLGSNPFNLAPTEYFIATAKYVDQWDASSGGGDLNATKVTFTVPPNRVYFHNATGNVGRALDILDVNFSFYFQKACGPGIAWGYPSLKEFNSTTISGDNITVYYNKKSYWAVQWAGGVPILNRDTWGKLWVTTNPGWQMDVKRYDPATADLNNNTVIDLFEDGTGAWKYLDYKKGEWVKLEANTVYYYSNTTIATRLGQMFHSGAGDVDSSTVVNTQDLGYMARSMFKTSAGPNGTGWNQYNVACDLNLDGTVNALDLALTTTNYGKTMG